MTDRLTTAGSERAARRRAVYKVDACGLRLEVRGTVESMGMEQGPVRGDILRRSKKGGQRSRRLDPDGWRLRRLWGVRALVCLRRTVQGEKDIRVVPRVEYSVDAGLCEIAYLKT